MVTRYRQPRRRPITNSLDTKPIKEIRAILENNNIPEEEIEEHLERVKAERLTRRGTNRKHAMSITAWRYVRTPLHREIQNATTCIKYKDWQAAEADVQRRHAYEVYLGVLNKLAAKFSEYVNLYPDMTPLQVLKEMQSKGKLSWVQDGNHWTDWVPDRIKAPIMQAFGEIPYRKQAKRKIPFERTVPKGHSQSKRALLNKALETELALRMRQLENGADAEITAAKINLIRIAQMRLTRKRDNLPLPNTWHDLMTNDELALAQEPRPPLQKLDLDKLRLATYFPNQHIRKER